MTNTQEMCGKEVVNICNPRSFFSEVSALKVFQVAPSGDNLRGDFLGISKGTEMPFRRENQLRKR